MISINKKEGNKQMKQWKQPLAFIGYVEGYDYKNKGSYWRWQSFSLNIPKPLCYVLEKIKFSTTYRYRGNDTNKNLIILLIQMDGSSVFTK